MRRHIPAMPPYLAWAEQAPQYERPDIPDRSPGTHHWTVPPELVDGVVIECLLHYDESGLIGILNYFPKGSPMDLPGDVTVVVHPARQRRGVGTTLVQEARRRWNVDLEDQCTTPAGAALIASLQEDHK